MNIVVVSHYFHPEIGAPSARILEMSRRWSQMGHNVEVVTCFPNHPHGSVYSGYELKKYMLDEFDGIKVHRNITYVTKNSGFLKKTIGHISLWPSSRVYSRNHIRKADVVIGSSPTFFAAMAARGFARSLDAPFIMEVRDLWPGVFKHLGVIRNKYILSILELWEMSLYRSADKIVTVTSSFRTDIVRRGIDKSKIHVILNGADLNFWRINKPKEKIRFELRYKENDFVVLYVGAHGISQRLRQVLDAAEILKQSDDIQFLFVGSGAEKKQLVEQASQQSLSNVKFIDPVDKETLKDYYAIANAVLVPLRNIPVFETFIPSKIFEIMAIGKPIIAALAGEAADIVEKSGGGVVIQPEDSKAISQAILALKADTSLCDKMSHLGKEYVQHNYNRDDLALEYVNVMKQAVEQS